MKKIVSLVLALLMIISFAACGGEYPEPTENGGDNKEPTKQEPSITLTSFTGVVQNAKEKGKLIVEVCEEYREALGELVIVIPEDTVKATAFAGDEITVTVSRIEHSTPLVVYASYMTIEYEGMPEKPILYFYPETETECSVKVNLANGYLSCTYPEHGEDGWQNFIARPDGTLIFPDGKEYYCLYWEALCQMQSDYSQGFCVKGSDTAAFLTDVLPKLGLNAREANEFIIYWLPQLQNNPYNLISFQTEAYTAVAGLEITPTPDSLLRVYMAAKPLTSYVEIEPQHFDGFIRNGFTVVEWGGHIEK